MTHAAFRKKVLTWYRAYGRHDLPWRHTRDPYRILVSEIMLQQTQVDRVREKYGEFLRAFPSMRKLAKSTPASVVRVWKGLGYNRRALNLRRAALAITQQHAGHLPQDIATLESLPGIGPYTARAVRVFVWNRREVVLETNIRRVYLHYFFPGRRSVRDSEIEEMIERTLPARNAREWYWALMDYGARALKGIENPNRRSRHYARQSRFEGSQRYARAKLLDFILARRTSAPLPIIKAYMMQDPYLSQWRDRVLEILAMLAADGFIERTKNGWRAQR
ncbi:MAG: A/G-specific adenine glycosylase [Patescibacteria group bacterium]